MNPKKRYLIGAGIGVLLFFAFKYGLPMILKKPTPPPMPPTPPTGLKGAKTKSFANASGEGENQFVANGFDPNHVNDDGSMGATWISFNNSKIVGYWQKGKVPDGTVLKP